MGSGHYWMVYGLPHRWRVALCVFRSKWATDSGGMWATDSGGKWATDSGVMWVQLSPVTGMLESVTGRLDSVTGMVAHLDRNGKAREGWRAGN